MLLARLKGGTADASFQVDLASDSLTPSSAYATGFLAILDRTQRCHRVSHHTSCVAECSGQTKRLIRRARNAWLSTEIHASGAAASATRLCLPSQTSTLLELLERMPYPSFQLGGSPCSISILLNLPLARAPVALAQGAMRARPSAKVVSRRLPKMRSTLL